MITLEDIRAARQRVGPVLRPTPVVRSDSLSRRAGRPVVLKPEHTQRTGSFKIRGAVNRISFLDAAERAAGVVTATPITVQGRVLDNLSGVASST